MDQNNQPLRTESYGQRDLPLLARWGVNLSQRSIRKYLPQGPPFTVLDCGCGYYARTLQALAPRLERGVGIDVKISPDCRSLPRLEFIESDLASALPRQAADQFDLVLLNSVLEHLWSPLETLRECHRVCRPEGLFYVNVPTWCGKTFHELLAFRLGLGGGQLEIDDHKMYYDKRDLWPLLVAAGFRPSRLRLHYHKFGLNLYAVCRK